MKIRLAFCTLQFFFTVIAFAQKNSNPIIGKNEIEITSFVIADHNLTYGGEAVYRLSLLKKVKVGAGALYGANIEQGNFMHGNTFGYGALFADIVQFIGHREKWSFGGQIGHGIYNHDYGYNKIKAGIYSSVSCNYRVIVSKKLLLNISFCLGYRNFHYEESRAVPEDDHGALAGLRLGVVF